MGIKLLANGCIEEFPRPVIHRRSVSVQFGDRSRPTRHVPVLRKVSTAGGAGEVIVFDDIGLIVGLALASTHGDGPACAKQR
ncbi:hypothetical protein [Catellatospora tritici]|uniref:hypothetical protein n=1 Tax=Catellatospora tritici TaxID=2851566 RepID=UPI001C2D6A57|nr:hypothetical protein [Catellatospora tritici]MBV1856700.1 hypothetical protein [Catellatospora tritici]